MAAIAGHSRRYALSIIGLWALSGCCGKWGCEWAFGTNWEGRHRLFVDGMLNTALGKPFANSCLKAGACVPQRIEYGLIRYQIDGWPQLEGCTYWYDVDPETNVVKAVGYRGDRQPDGKEPCWLPLN